MIGALDDELCGELSATGIGRFNIEASAQVVSNAKLTYYCNTAASLDVRPSTFVLRTLYIDVSSLG
jgi:hypothetical protein